MKINHDKNRRETIVEVSEKDLFFAVVLTIVIPAIFAWAWITLTDRVVPVMIETGSEYSSIDEYKYNGWDNE